jgi:uncharacterized membrane protein YjjP (DUF1212 family)
MNVRSIVVSPVNAPATRLLLALARGFQTVGLPAHRLEARVLEVADALGVQAAVFADPTSVAIDFGDRTRTLAVQNGDEDLARMVALDALGQAVSMGNVSAEEALERLEDLEEQPPRWSENAVLAAFAVTSGSGAVLFGGGLNELLVSTLSGLAIGLLARSGPLFPVLASLTAALVGTALPVSMQVVVLSSCIVLLPGLTITVGLSEMANGHLAAGSARLAKALTVLLQLGVGTALGIGLLPEAVPVHIPLPSWTEHLSIVIGAFSFVVLLQARLRDALVIVLASEGANLGWTVGAPIGPLGPALVGALAVGLVANVQARIRDVPAAVAMVPGILLLVPGSVGFRAIDAFAAQDVLAGMNGAFACVQTAAALVSGLLVANALVKAR